MSLGLSLGIPYRMTAPRSSDGLPATPTCVYTQHNDVASLIGASDWPTFSLGRSTYVSATIAGGTTAYMAAPYISGSASFDPSALLTFSGTKKLTTEIGVTCPADADFSSGSAYVWIQFYTDDALSSGVVEYVWIGRLSTGGIHIYGRAGEIDVTLPGAALSDERFLVFLDSATKKLGVRYGGTTYMMATAPLSAKAGAYMAIMANIAGVTGAAVGKTLSATVYTSTQDWALTPNSGAYDFCNGLVAGYALNESLSRTADESGNRILWIP